MDIRKQLSLEQQFELQVFEVQVRRLSQEDAHELLIRLQESMLYQSMTFREMLKEAWGIGKNFDIASNMLADG
ncbi:Phycobilisome degradation protein nblA [Tumidithrix helvetica PCC 7403]|uniref:NblA/ycf18 family protein n=1 Tax=Tumidithrix helvetica TaxID=3457545 RepID=UPI003C8385FB